ncbi:outer membrane lipoprotein chaperone LolA [Marinobacter sp. CHS3-4]|uniref:outer membrane lipoprotein chaperone LolA n=1 Tax=Marinobacter sp. CHS3-4 TaxID=3045174 RepID=UPI0024B51D75|nr:outer membrane lipoprotein chaperone LolA [Marinobacter sp. CHS3-4]MDI9245490.1 outer membrane lipoprotein chaperone LolA [Marinobacter sp. CHS3-4]
MLAFLIVPWCSVSAANDGSDAAAELAGLLGGYESFSATFIQIVVNENGSRVQETRGELKARRPGLFYWETSSPHSQFVVSDGEQVEVYDPDLEQVTIHTLDDRVATTPALLLSGEVDNLDESYRVSVRSFGENSREFTLEPRDQDSLFVSLRLTFNGGELQEMRMQDSLAQLSVLSFNNIQVNGSIPKSTFSLDYPDSVDVIRDGA